MNFCSNCGSSKLSFKIPQNDHRHRFVCEDCNNIFYDNPQIVVGTIPYYNDQILLARRGIEPQKGKWNLPAGFLEKEESISTGALRETIEETNCDVKEINLHSIYYSQSHHYYIFYKAELNSKDFKQTFESTEIKFFEKSDIPWNDIAFESNIHAIKSYFEANSDIKKVYFETEKF